MRTWLILLALAALMSTGASHQEHRASRKGGHSRKLHGNARGAEGKASFGFPVQGFSGIRTNVEEEIQKQKAAMARFVVHNSLTLALGTKASIKGLTKYVGNNIEIVSDTIDGKSTGIPYLFFSKNDYSEWDLQKDDHASMFFSRVVVDKHCHNLPLHAKDPDCPGAELFGRVVPVTDPAEYAAAFKSLAKKVPGLNDVKHGDYILRKLVIEAVLVRGPNGSFEPIDVELYKTANPDDYNHAAKETKSN